MPPALQRIELKKYRGESAILLFQSYCVLLIAINNTAIIMGTAFFIQTYYVLINALVTPDFRD